MQKEFVTADVYLSASLALQLNIEPSYRVKNKKTLTIFPASDELYKAMNEYNNGCLVNALEFVQMIKRIRAEMIMRRNSEGQENGIPEKLV